MKSMATFSRTRLAIAVVAIAAASVACTTAPRFGQPDADFQGRISTQPGVILPGSQVKVQGSNFKPGQKAQLFYEGGALTGAVTADAEGKFSTETTIPQAATPGRHAVLVSATEPSASAVHTLKVSPDLPLSGADRFAVQARKTVTGVYQSAYSAKNKALFVTSAIGRPPVKESELAKLAPDSLDVVAKVTPGQAPGRKDAQGKAQDGGVFAVYGVGVDDANGNVWVSNTRQNTVAVYRQSDLKLVKQFEPGAIGHSRDVMVDEKNGKVFVNGAMSDKVAVFDARTLQLAATLELKGPAPQRAAGGFPGRNAGPAPFATMAMSFDKASGKLFVVGSSGEVAVIDAATNAVEKTYAVKGVNGAIAIAYDGGTRRVFVGAQGTDNVVVANADNGEVIKDVKVGAGTLGLVFDPVRKLVYAANRGAGTVTVLDTDGTIVANLEGGPLPNHLSLAPNGVVYALNKGKAEDVASNNIHRIQPR